MSGNLLMFKGQDAMHHYALLLRTSMPLLYAVRAALVAAVVLHVVSAWQLTMRSRAARPQDYAMRRPQVTTFAAKTMRWGGVLLLVFIVFHLLQLTLGVVHPRFMHLDPYNNVVVGLRNPLVAGFYVLAMAALALHLYHGIWAAVRTLGAARPSVASTQAYGRRRGGRRGRRGVHDHSARHPGRRLHRGSPVGRILVERRNAGRHPGAGGRHAGRGGPLTC